MTNTDVAATPHAPPTGTAGTCPNCDTPLVGRYCHACGQKRIDEEERRFSHFVAEFIREVTLLDGRAARSLTRLLFRPGTVDRDWIAGRRRQHMAPVTLFLLANLLYFFHPPLTDLNLSLPDQLRQQVYGGFATSLVEARLGARGITFSEYAGVYREHATSFAKLMVILHVPILAAVLLLLHVRRHVFYVDHVAVAMHFWTFLLLHAMATPLLFTLVATATGIGTRAVFQVSVLVVMVLYLWQQVRVAYGQSGWLAAAKLPALLAGLVLSHLAYRFVQFIAVFAMT
ncbi:MAG TPA: DUF3667 domain-containing protein [Longimicrobiales bacterium]|nr:DUF3667 domain-containing protein [Longimicrobiales bacterium]